MADSCLSDIEFVEAVQSFEWTFAKTMPHIPHEYIVRGKTADEDTYITMFHTIEARGKFQDWNGTQYKCLHPGDGFKYWIMTDNIDESIIINRAKAKDYATETCPVCGQTEFVGPGDHCFVCNWECDLVQHNNPDEVGGANIMSVNQAREVWRKGKVV